MATSTYEGMTRNYCSMFDKQAVELFDGVRVVGKDISSVGSQSSGGGWKEETEEYEESKRNPGDQDPVSSEAVEKTGMSCFVCQVPIFESLEAQREHFKLDWHRFNVKQKLMDKQVLLSEEEFEDTISGELSSISGSDTSESETEKDDLILESTIQTTQAVHLVNDGDRSAVNHGWYHPKMFLVNNNDFVFTVYRAVVYSSKCVPDESNELVANINSICQDSLWIILMTAGGHFAGAVFEGDNVVTHKTFHRYTVRAKRGTAQGLRDSQQGKQPKSAGASLRRYNETALIQEVRDLLETWSDHLSQCHKLFIRIPTYNQHMFFGGKNSPLINKADPRIRTIPFATRRPTFNEVKRVHKQLATIEILGKEHDVLTDILSKLSRSPKTSSSLPNKSPKDGEKESSTSAKISAAFHEGVDEEEVHYVGDGSRSTASSQKRGKTKKSKRKKQESGQQSVADSTGGPTRDVVLPEHHLWNRLYCAVVSGNMKVVTEIFGTVDCTVIQAAADGSLNDRAEETTESEIQEGLGTVDCTVTQAAADGSLNDRAEETIESEIQEAQECLGTVNCTFIQVAADRAEETIKSAKHEVQVIVNEAIDQSYENVCSKESRRDPNQETSHEKSLDTSIHQQDSVQTNLNTSGKDGWTEDLRNNPSNEENSSVSFVEKVRKDNFSSSHLKNDIMKPNGVIIVNERWGEGGSTLLHAAARSPHDELVYVLLQQGADPAIRDDRGRTPYDAAGNKEARNQFRRFMANFPDAYDYSKGHIPSPLSQEQQEGREKKEAEKKKAQRKAKKQRTKEQKAVELKKMEEEKEKTRLANLSDREKRALAAERRLAQQQSSKNEELFGSCAMCSRSLAGRVPFERLTYKYCNTTCVREHRLILENKGR